MVGHVHGDEKRDALVEHAAGIYVGDTITDVKSALDASAIAVGVTTGPDERAEAARRGRRRRARLARRVPGLALDDRVAPPATQSNLRSDVPRARATARASAPSEELRAARRWPWTVTTTGLHGASVATTSALAAGDVVKATR